MLPGSALPAIQPLYEQGGRWGSDGGTTSVTSPALLRGPGYPGQYARLPGGDQGSCDRWYVL